MATIHIANNKSFEIRNDDTILDAAGSANLVLEYSCRTGRCESCKSKVVSGKTKALRIEEGLSAEDKKQGYILTCCRTAESEDVVLDIQDLGKLADIKTITLPCRIDKLEQAASDIMIVTLRLPPNNTFEYLPGQYLNIIRKNGVRRSYSIANAPCKSNKIELQIQKVANGVMSHYWFNEATINDLLRFEGPLGTFFLRDTDTQHIVFLATGSGIAPIKALLEEITNNPVGINSKQIHIYWGGRKEQDIYWLPDKILPNIHFHPCLSQADAAWQGKQDYVQNALLNDKVPLNDAVIYACGSDTMIHSAHDTLIKNGLDPNNFYSDAFVSSN